MAQPERDSRRWRAVVARDTRQEYAFVYAVRTTGVFCRCSCPAKTPHRENVCFYSNAVAARAAGYRACKRCHPEQAPPRLKALALVTRACRNIENSDGAPVLDELATQAGLSRYHFHRLFKAVTGVTPRSYWVAHTSGRLRDSLAGASSVTAAIHDAGFGSARQFYDISDEVLGMTPSRFKAGGAATNIKFALGTCSLGHILVAATDKGVCAVLLGDDAKSLVTDLRLRFARAAISGADKAFEKTLARVIACVDGHGRSEGLPLDVQGTAFQRRVWEALRAIPPGTTQSYTQVAAQIGAAGSVRAVAGACAANPLAVLVPCHRVVRSNGDLSGYRWGIGRKRALLERERTDAVPKPKKKPARS